MEYTSHNLVKIAIFYDGNYFAHVSHYYKYVHQKKTRINVHGLHGFIENKVAELERVGVQCCKIVEAHYFRGRYSARDSKDANKLFSERQFEDILMYSGVVTHYTPMTSKGEKGIDVWFALETLELAILKKFDIVVLVASDGDYVPLVKKLNALGVKVMILGWDFNYVDTNGKTSTTTTSHNLIDEATYPMLMNVIIDDQSNQNNIHVQNLFVTMERPPLQPFSVKETKTDNDENAKFYFVGKVYSIKDGFGFVLSEQEQKTYFFYYSEVKHKTFSELTLGERVQYQIGTNERGECAINITAAPASFDEDDVV